MSNNLNTDQMIANQDQKEVTSNDADGQIDAALTESVSIAIDNTNAVTLTADEWTRNQMITFTDNGTTGECTASVPATARGLFTVINECGQALNVEIAAQTGDTPQVVNGSTVVLACDGVDVFFLGTAEPADSASEPSTGRPSYKGAVLKLGGSFTTSGSDELLNAWASADYDTMDSNGLKFWLGADLTFTTTHATEQLTATGHGMISGDGPLRLTNSGGALPTGFATATNYWVIYVDANTIQLAASYTDAVAGTAVTISDDGSGTHTLDRASRIVIPGETIIKVKLKAAIDTASGSTADHLQLYIDQDAGGSAPGVGMVATAVSTTAGERGLRVETPAIEVSGGEFFEIRLASGPDVDNTAATYFSIEVVEDSDVAHYDLGSSFGGLPDASAVVFQFLAVRAFTIPEDAVESQGKASVAATAQADFDIQKNGGSVGTMRFAAAATIPTFIVGSEVVFAPGDDLSVHAPGLQDATLSDIVFTFAGRI